MTMTDGEKDVFDDATLVLLLVGMLVAVSVFTLIGVVI